MKQNIKIEICAGSLTDVITASSVEEVDRIELNSSLELGGITPSLATLQEAKKQSNKKIICMVRPRPAGFVYNEYEKKTMLEDAKIFLDHGADGIVFGCLKEDLTIDEDYTNEMVTLIHSYQKEAVFHKAFDETPNLLESLESLKRCNVDRILTSGGKSDVLTGSNIIQELESLSEGILQILPGGGVSEDNAKKVLEITGCKQIHMTAKETYEDCGSYYAVSKERIEKILSTFSSDKQVKQGHRLTGEDIEMIQNDAYEKDYY